MLFRSCVLGKEGNNRYIGVTLGEVTLHKAAPVIVHTPQGDRIYQIRVEHMLGETRVTGEVNGRPFTVQMERSHTRNPLAIRVIHNGTQMDAIVMHPRTAELHQLMPYKAPPDMSRFVLSPMPGLLTQVAVQPAAKIGRASCRERV